MQRNINISRAFFNNKLNVELVANDILARQNSISATVDANGHLTSYKADVDTDANYTPDTEVVSNGYFHESEYRAAPYFDIQINGITLLNAEF